MIGIEINVILIDFYFNYFLMAIKRLQSNYNILGSSVLA